MPSTDINGEPIYIMSAQDVHEVFINLDLHKDVGMVLPHFNKMKKFLSENYDPNNNNATGT